MKRNYLLMILLCFCLADAFGNNKQKKDVYRYQIDTLSIFNGSVFAEISSFRNDTVYKRVTAYLIRDYFRVPVWGPLGNLVTRKRSIIKILKHGTEIFQNNDGRKIIAEYNKGEEIKTTYYNANGNLISHNEFRENRIYIDNWPISKDEFIILPKRYR